VGNADGLLLLVMRNPVRVRALTHVA